MVKANILTTFPQTAIKKRAIHLQITINKNGHSRAQTPT